MNKEEFIKEVKNLGIELDDKAMNLLSMYSSFLTEYNKHTNLTRISDEESIYLKHFYDSLTILKSGISFEDINTLIDVGTGAGFPGMVIGIIFPKINVTLLDSNNKKIKFLDELICHLGLKNVKTINERSEEFSLNNLDSFDLVTSRAVASLPVLTEISLPLVKVGGYFIAMKGEVEEELIKSKKIIRELNGEVSSVISFNLPKEESKRNIVVIKKDAKTPKGFPRSYSKIVKSNK